MIRLVSTQLRNYEGKQIVVGNLEDISQELFNFITEVKAHCPKNIVFADKDQVPAFPTICVMADYPEEIVVYFKKAYPNQPFIEFGIAHELMHVHLKHYNKIPQLNISGPNPKSVHRIRLIENIIQDFWVDKELEKRGFDPYESFKKSLKDEVGSFKHQRSIHDSLHATGIYVQFYAFRPRFLQGMRATNKLKRNYKELKKIYAQKVPKIAEDAERVIEIIRKHDIYTNKGYVECVNEVFAFLLPQIGFVMEKTP